MRRIGSALALLAALVFSASAQEPFWEQQPFERWSKKQCEQLLSESPWARSSAGVRPTVAANSGGRTTYMMGPRVEYRAQLWSAVQIRQAMVRYSRLDSNYVSLPAEARKAHDDESARFLNAQFADSVVVQVLFWKKDPRWTQFWQSRSVATLKEIISLESPRGAVAPVHFTPPTHDKAEFQVVFPRSVNGLPLLETAEDYLTLKMELPSFPPYLQQTVLVHFQAKEMRVGGKLVY